MEQRKIVKNFIYSRKLLRPGDKLLLAVSGGVDSVVLAHILASLREELNVELAVATFDHGLRPESAAEADFVVAYAKSLELPCFRGSAPIASLAVGHNVEDVARRERYAFLRHIAFQWGGALIATGHHSQDQAETVLHHLLRGSGPAGLSGIAPRRGDLIRPLLPLSRADILDYAQQNNLRWMEDASNASLVLLRNRIRWQLLPELTEYNPQIISSLNATAEICRDEDALLDDMAENALAELANGDGTVLDWEGFCQLPLALRRRVLRKAFCLVAGDSQDLSFAQVEAVLSLKEEQSAALSHGFLAYRRGDLVLSESQPALPVYTEEYPLLVDGQWHELGNWGWAYQALLQGERNSAVAHSFCLEESLVPQVCWRTRRNGDAVASSGYKEKEKLKKLFIDAHIPQWQRAGWPLLTAGESILWAPRLWRQPQDAGKSSHYVLIKAKQYDKIKH